LFEIVDRRIALLLVFFSLVGTAVESANLLNQFTPLVLLDSARPTDQLQALAYAPVGLVSIGYSIQQVIYAFYLLSAAYVVFRSMFVGRVIGVLLAIAALAYLTYSFGFFLSPAFAARLVPYIQLPSLIGEAAFCLSLLALGVNVERWMQQANRTAGIRPGSAPSEALG
jgi:Domain of unknown function (DUF4386)